MQSSNVLELIGRLDDAVGGDWMFWILRSDVSSSLWEATSHQQPAPLIWRNTAENRWSAE